MLDKRNFYINGKWVKPSKSNDFEVINPSNEEPFAIISLGSKEDTNAAVKAAKEAFVKWKETSKEERINLLEKLLKIYKKRFNELAEAQSMEMGAPIDYAISAQTASGQSHLEDFILRLKNFKFEEHFDSKSNNHISYEPIGVCGLITPWNWPINQIALKVFPAFATGCTMILKPPEIAPISPMLYAEMVHEAGFPKGVFNLVNGDGTGVGTQISGHPDIDMISFTGAFTAGDSLDTLAFNIIMPDSSTLGNWYISDLQLTDVDGNDTTYSTSDLASGGFDVGFVLVNSTVVSVDANPSSYPERFTLFSNYPNPFNPATTIRFVIESESILATSLLQIYDINGHLVKTLVQGEIKSGHYEIQWDASDQPSGMYFVHLTVGSRVQTQKMILLK